MPGLLTSLRALRRPRTPAFWLLLGQLVMFTGIAALFPVAPLYVRQHGGGAAAIGLFVAGPLAANMLVQVPAGRLVDRVGRRPVLIGSRLAYAVLALALFADVGPLWLLALLRTLQGVCSGAYVPALMAALTDLSEPGKRGERFAQMQACEVVGLLIGPSLGGVAALWRISAAFGVSGLAVLIGLAPMWRVPETRGSPPQHQARDSFRWWRMRGIIVPATGLFAIGAIFSMYDVVWPQYLSVRGYGAAIIGLSITLFAVPILLLARTGGRLSDRMDKRLLVPAAMVLTAVCASSYPFLHDLLVIQSVGTLEAVAFVFLEPGLFAVIGDSAPEQRRGEAMGVGGFFQFGGSAIGAAVLGTLYGVAEGLPFWSSGGLLVATAILCAVALPARVGPRHAPADDDALTPLPMREGEAV